MKTYPFDLRAREKKPARSLNILLSLAMLGSPIIMQSSLAQEAAAAPAALATQSEQGIAPQSLLGSTLELLGTKNSPLASGRARLEAAKANRFSDYASWEWKPIDQTGEEDFVQLVDLLHFNKHYMRVHGPYHLNTTGSYQVEKVAPNQILITITHIGESNNESEAAPHAPFIEEYVLLDFADPTSGKAIWGDEKEFVLYDFSLTQDHAKLPKEALHHEAMPSSLGEALIILDGYAVYTNQGKAYYSTAGDFERYSYSNPPRFIEKKGDAYVDQHGNQWLPCTQFSFQGKDKQASLSFDAPDLKLTLTDTDAAPAQLALKATVNGDIVASINGYCSSPKATTPGQQITEARIIEYGPADGTKPAEGESLDQLCYEALDSGSIEAWQRIKQHCEKYPNSLTESQRGLTPLAYAYMNDLKQEEANGYAKQLRHLLAALLVGDPIDRADDNGNTSLYYAAALGDKALAMWLVEHGANVNVINPWGETPLKKLNKNAPELEQWLISRGATRH